MFKLAPSILSANFAKLEDDIKKVIVPGVEYIHVDVMDGNFVPNITIGAPVVRAIKKISPLPLDVHLMIEKPELHVDDFINAGSDILTIHIEATKHPERLLSYIRSKGVKAGVSLNPATDLSTIAYIYEAVDLILLMTVNPGFGGQKLIPATLKKIRELSKIKKDNGYKFIIQVDGGVTEENIKEYTKAGAELVVAGNAIFGSSDPARAIKTLLERGK